MTREEWIDEIEERLAAGEEALELTIEKYNRVLGGMLMHTGFFACPLCHVFYLENEVEDCFGCPVARAGEDCTVPDSIHRRLWKLNENPTSHDSRDDFIADTVIPFLEGLRGE